MYKYWLDDDPDYQTHAYFDRHGEKMVVRSSQNMTPYLELNKEQRKEDLRPFGRMRKVASLPPVIVDKLMREGIWQDKARFRRWLNESDQKVFRTNNEVI